MSQEAPRKGQDLAEMSWSLGGWGGTSMSCLTLVSMNTGRDTARGWEAGSYCVVYQLPGH